MREEAVHALRECNEVIERLRAPGGCPWDREQTHATLAPYVLEETYELLDAIRGGDSVALQEELGDVLLQVLMHSAIAAERGDGGFDIGDVAECTRLKMIRRHPHVFSDLSIDSAEGVVVNWEKVKAAEKSDRLSLLEGVPSTLPALARAQATQKRPARVGLDLTPTIDDAVAHLRTALDELMVAAATVATPVRGQDWAVSEGDVSLGEAPVGAHVPSPPPASEKLVSMVGKTLFDLVALARRLRVDAEDALRHTTDSFAARFRELEASARAEGVDLHDLTEEQWHQRWLATATE